MKVRDLLFRNLLTKIFSLIVAVVLWFAVIGEKQAQIQLDIPLEVVNIPEGMVLTTDIPSSISVQVMGPRTLIRTLSGLGIRKSIDLEKMDVGWATIRILPETLSLPRGIDVIRLTPSALDVKLEPAIAVNLPVSPQVSGDPARGYRIEKITVDPAEVLLKGGEGELSGLSAVKTHPVSVSQAVTDVEERVGFELEGLHLKEVKPPTAWVRAKISPVLVERTLEGIPLKVSSSILKATVVPDQVTILMKGPAEIIDGIKAMDIQASVAVEGLGIGNYKVAPTIVTPNGVRIAVVEPSMVEVTLERPPGQE
jgi:YbbR domain-containing protein